MSEGGNSKTGVGAAPPLGAGTAPRGCSEVYDGRTEYIHHKLLNKVTKGEREASG